MKKLIKKMDEAAVAKAKELKLKLKIRRDELEEKRDSLSNSISKNFDLDDSEDSDMKKLSEIIKKGELYVENKKTQSIEFYNVNKIYKYNYGFMLNIELFGLKYEVNTRKDEQHSDFEKDLQTICYFYSAIKELEEINLSLKDFIDEKQKEAA